ncbi:MAG: hypothetical protein KatS3mg115_1466 [Candidatus Poribacteria bacterium]|nr:MAG: hypothetical protein KatS3mg115_1466 [Candidatus Poribacteria bacterium]
MFLLLTGGVGIAGERRVVLGGVMWRIRSLDAWSYQRVVQSTSPVGLRFSFREEGWPPRFDMFWRAIQYAGALGRYEGFRWSLRPAVGRSLPDWSPRAAERTRP